MQVTYGPDEPWLFWLGEKPEDPQFEPHAGINMVQVLGSPVHIYVMLRGKFHRRANWFCVSRQIWDPAVLKILRKLISRSLHAKSLRLHWYHCQLEILRGDYTTRFGNFTLYYNFLTNSLKFIKLYIIRKGISQGRQLRYYFFTKNQHFWENHKKHVFCHFSFKTGYRKIEIQKLLWNCFIDLNHSFRCCVFSFLWIFADFLSFMPNKAKISLFYRIFKFLTLFGMKF